MTVVFDMNNAARSDTGSDAALADPADDPDSRSRPKPWWYIRQIWGGAVAGRDIPTPAPPTLAEGQPGMRNLRELRVSDVSVPKADIIAVPVTITKDDLVTVFRDSGLTRLPVYNGTLDTPLGFVHLKDFALKHGFAGRRRAVSAKADVAAPIVCAAVHTHWGFAVENAGGSYPHGPCD